jgi:hypothetical protein
VQYNARMCGQPGVHLFDLVHPEIIEYPMHRWDSWGNFSIPMRQKGDTFHLPFPFGCRRIDFACPCIKTRKEMQGSCTDVLMFDSPGLARCRRQGRGLARSGLQTGFFVHAQDHFP